MTQADCKTLGITIKSDEQQLRSAYVKLAKKYHPDGGSPEADAVKFSEVRISSKYNFEGT